MSSPPPASLLAPVSTPTHDGLTSSHATCIPPSVSAAIASFRPSPLQIISGIAPHVIDERRRRGGPRHPPPYSWRPEPPWLMASAGRTGTGPSPLRLAAVLTWEEEFDLLDEEAVDTKDTSTSTVASLDANTNEKGIKSRRRWRVAFRLDIHVLRAIAVKLKSI